MGTGNKHIKRSVGNADVFRKYTARTMAENNSRATRNLT